MRRSALAVLFAAGLAGLPASAQNYCAAVVPNDAVRDLKGDILSALRGVATGDRNVGNWPGSTTGMLEVGADQGTMKMIDNMWRTGLALHATLCSGANACSNARRFFQAAGTNNYLKRYGDSTSNSFQYVDLQTSYQELLRNRPFTLKGGAFEPEDWGSWYAFSLGGSLWGYTKTPRGTETKTAVSGALHVSFIKVKYGSKESTNARNISDAIRGAVGDKEVRLTFSEVRCN